MGTTVSVQRTGDALLILWRGRTTAVDLATLQEVWVVRLGDIFSGPNERVLLLVQQDSFVAVSTQTPGLMIAIRATLERLSMGGRLRCADALRLPRAWSLGIGLFPTDLVEPSVRPVHELQDASSSWHVAEGDCLEEAFS